MLRQADLALVQSKQGRPAIDAIDDNYLTL
jgi:hypothetical protein